MKSDSKASFRKIQCNRLRLKHSRGSSMLEFVIALLIFSTGVTGLMSTQLVGRKASLEATQRSLATGLARDIIERIRANPQALTHYSIPLISAPDDLLPEPDQNCEESNCSTAQLAAFDLWQWWSMLAGTPTKDGSTQDIARRAGGLMLPLACIKTENGFVQVTISWLAQLPAGEAESGVCGIDAMESSADESTGMTEPGRRRVVLSTYLVR
ncbi:MAG: type IV pilus assembly protein PilV [Halioglobus sp.]|jgi:type IV pilus assembly protein PilV